MTPIVPTTDPADGARRRLAEAARAHRRPPLALTTMRRGLGPYRGYGEMLEAMERLVARGARATVVGESVLGEPIFAVEVGPAAKPGEPTTAILSGVHPEEWIGIEVHLALLERLVEEPPARTVLSIPTVNVDGIGRVEEHLRRGVRKFVRHNARGVDLNRNFPSLGSSRGLVARLLSPLFAPGSGPASEPEIRAIVGALGGRRIDRAVSLHSFGGAVLVPYAQSMMPPDDVGVHLAWARAIGRGADRRWPYRATPSSWWVPGVRARGLELDWLHDHHGAISLLVECSRPRPLLDGVRRLLDPFGWFNPGDPGAVALPLVEALGPFVRGDALPG